VAVSAEAWSAPPPGQVRLKWKLAFGQGELPKEEPFLAGAETLALIEILGFDGSNDFVTEANA
jgi:hypothetical protein